MSANCFYSARVGGRFFNSFKNDNFLVLRAVLGLAKHYRRREKKR